MTGHPSRHLAACTLAALAVACGGGGGGGGGGDGDGDGDTLTGDVTRCPTSLRTSLPAGQHGGFDSAGQARSFLLLLPPASFTGPRPILVVFHGTGLSGAEVVDDYLLQNWAADGFIVVAPDANGNGTVWPVWDSLRLPGAPATPNPDDTFFDDLLACVAGHHDVDAKRVFVAGHSAGGSMVHHLLGRRASLLAGGIAASGPFDATQPSPLGAASPLTVIVTWGGDEDRYTGSAGEVFASVGFAEQASLASTFWEARPQAHQVACNQDGAGHVWLRGINGWLIDALLASPKGGTGALPALPAICSEAAYQYVSPITVTCGTSTTAGCQAYCQLLGDCLAENGSFGQAAGPALAAIGFSGSGDVCGGCVAQCQADASGSAPDATVLSCLATAAPAAACGMGFQGMAAFPAVGGCCAGAAGSHVCARFCGAFASIPIFAAQLTGCP